MNGLRCIKARQNEIPFILKMKCMLPSTRKQNKHNHCLSIYITCFPVHNMAHIENMSRAISDRDGRCWKQWWEKGVITWNKLRLEDSDHIHLVSGKVIAVTNTINRDVEFIHQILS